MDHPDVYNAIPTSQLFLSLANLELIKHDWAVSLIASVLQSRLMNVAAFSRLLYAVVRRTTFDHFCAGETLEEAALSLQRNRDRGLRGILDHSVEDALDNESCDRNAESVLHAIKTIGQMVEDVVTHACVKVSAICPLPVLEHVSRLLRWKHVQNKSVSLPWLEPSLPIFAPESPIHIAKEPPPLSGEEEADLQRCMDRIRSICLACASQRNGAGLPLLIDAEYLSIQPAIDYIASVCMREFNESKPGSTISFRGADPPLVHTTVQAYLRDAPARLRCALEGAEKAGVRYGVKLVRGAYMSKENALAQLAGVPSPIHPSIERTHEAYDRCAGMMIDCLANTHGGGPSLVLATHNARSAANAVERAKDRLLPIGDVRIQFAQLKGMADRLSFALAKAGHLVTKYVPFGKIEEVVPYLVRRAEENKGIVGNTADERAALRREIWRRLSLPSQAAR